MKAIAKLTTAFLFFVICQNLYGQCNNVPVAISGNTCQGAVLKATLNSAVSSITWNLNGAAVGASQAVSISSNGSIVAGGNGSGTGLNQLANPVRIFVDASDNLYIPDMGNNRIVKWAPGAPVTFNAIATDVGNSIAYQWKKNGLKTGSNASVYIDQAIVDGDAISCELTTSGACLASTSAISNKIALTVLKPSPPVSLGPDVTICPGTEVILKAGQGYASYLWQDASTANIHTATTPGRYIVQVKDICGFSSSDTAVVSFYPKSGGFLPANVSFCNGGSVELAALASFKQYLWSNSASTPLIEVRDPGMYWLEVVDHNNCKQRDTVLVRQKECGKRFYVPNIFTPNGDGRNETFKPVLYDNTKQYRFSVYNRWGQLVFTSSEPGKGWDGRINGKSQDANVFLWTCTYQFSGEPVRSEKGTVVLAK
ncbi:gliding motility-associated C-terminal domain-containing protein [Chitinophagaceae bacterium LB-8]|uniref:Gliding motility-associated C-terminal domain-containing protein n=2 Tax=Paraflavisolibacter caeni TaxID=2982496 RepID=A0A9X2XS60_9BACT|nr:gliding motility-associated C-terminal domain-containing protein [Paraflavisolibacter caeni]MCU7547540.1 gliding motility-associated C-terminal domain-containing protein [Paraflavisolibacter caeni]